VPVGPAVAEVADVQAVEVDASTGGGDAEELAGVRAGGPDRPGHAVALGDEVVHLAAEVGERRSPHGHEVPEPLPVHVALLRVGDEPRIEEVVDHLEPALVDDLVEHPLDDGLVVCHARGSSPPRRRITACRFGARGAILEGTVSRPGGRGAGPGDRGRRRGRSGLHRAGCWRDASRGDPQESATENRPPMGRPGDGAVTGKGETVREERTSARGDPGGSVNPTRSKVERGRAGPADLPRWTAQMDGHPAPQGRTEPRLQAGSPSRLRRTCSHGL
jgi:hypothetical protein